MFMNSCESLDNAVNQFELIIESSSNQLFNSLLQPIVKNYNVLKAIKFEKCSLNLKTMDGIPKTDNFSFKHDPKVVISRKSILKSI